MVYTKSKIGEFTKKKGGIIKIEQKGVIHITAHPKQTIEWFNNFKLKGVELIPEEM